MIPTERDKPDAELTNEEIARRRDDVIRRMANTPPQPEAKEGQRRKSAEKARAEDGSQIG